MKQIDVRVRAVMVWVATLLACVYPKLNMPDAVRDFVRQPWFVVVFPLAMAGVTFLIPVRGPVSEEEREERHRRKVGAQGWTALLGLSVMVTAFFGWVLVDVLRDTTETRAEHVKDCLEGLGLILVGLVGVVVSVRKLKRLGHLWF